MAISNMGLALDLYYENCVSPDLCTRWKKVKVIFIPHSSQGKVPFCQCTSINVM